ncbi:TCAF1 [Branchiostoma lanceolatum]|uniref:TCAF1 protein n=1 Tax=Branchiostoma lanceolatum TaxID=7740 RepID=A0A8J9W8H5_BRALA|nr:TCAF1 [Branchiostoma lanceolatum]
MALNEISALLAVFRQSVHNRDYKADKKSRKCKWTPWKMASLADHKDTWRGELLRGISSVPTIGVPGRLACFEDCAEPILLDDSGQPVMAAARIGKGAIIVFSHDGYMEKFKQNDENFCQLFDNCLAWLNVERKTVVYDDDITEASQLPTSGALVVDGGGNGLEKDSFNPTEMLVFWDKVVQAHHDLRGTDPSDFPRERVVADSQPCAGYMHAGYPIVTHLDIADKDSDASVLNMSLLETKGNWGLFHELGHNMQRGAWTFEGTTEVTCNIFTLHAMHTLVGIDPWRHPWLRNQWKDIHQYLKKPCYNAWKENPGVGLGVYAQLAHHFGWEPYKKVFREYERDVHPPSDNQDKIDRWVIRFSRTVRRNLVPLFEFWGLSAGETAKAEVSEFPSFLPKDEITTMHQSV